MNEDSEIMQMSLDWLISNLMNNKLLLTEICKWWKNRKCLKINMKVFHIYYLKLEEMIYAELYRREILKKERLEKEKEI